MLRAVGPEQPLREHDPRLVGEQVGEGEALRARHVGQLLREPRGPGDAVAEDGGQGRRDEEVEPPVVAAAQRRRAEHRAARLRGLVGLEVADRGPRSGDPRQRPRGVEHVGEADEHRLRVVGRRRGRRPHVEVRERVPRQRLRARLRVVAGGASERRHDGDRPLPRRRRRGRPGAGFASLIPAGAGAGGTPSSARAPPPTPSTSDTAAVASPNHENRRPPVLTRTRSRRP